MSIKATAAEHDTPHLPTTGPHAPGPSCPRGESASGRGGLHVRLEGAPWLSLRDRCGEARPALRAHQRASTRHGAQGSGWRSLSRLEVAMALVLLALLSAIFRGAQSDPMLAFMPPEAASDTQFMVAPVSLVE